MDIGGRKADGMAPRWPCGQVGVSSMRSQLGGACGGRGATAGDRPRGTQDEKRDRPCAGIFVGPRGLSGAINAELGPCRAALRLRGAAAADRWDPIGGDGEARV